MSLVRGGHLLRLDAGAILVSTFESLTGVDRTYQRDDHLGEICIVAAGAKVVYLRRPTMRNSTNSVLVRLIGSPIEELSRSMEEAGTVRSSDVVFQVAAEDWSVYEPEIP